MTVSKLTAKLKLKVEAGGSQVVDQTETKAGMRDNATVELSRQRVAEIQAALGALDADDRATWWRAGAAVHSEAPTAQGYGLWTGWSQSSGKFNEDEQRRTWAKFTERRGINIHSLFWLANQSGGAGTGDSRDGKSANRFDAMKLGKLFVETYRRMLRFDAAMGHWYLFNGVIWIVDKLAPLRLAKALVEDLSAGDGPNGGTLAAFRNPSGLNQIERMAVLETNGIGITDAEFDVKQNLLAVKNGVIDLLTGEFRRAEAADLLRRCADVEFDAEATCPLWVKFVDDVTLGDKKLARFLQRAVGYTLFGHTNAQVFFVIEGSGGNGKGVFLRVLAALFGQYATEFAPNLVTSAYSGNANSPSSALVKLRGIRLGIVTELPNKRGLDTAFVKQFSGGDSITARANYGEPFTFKPEGKLWISTNDMPDIAANDKAMWRRIVPIPFLANFPVSKRDEELEGKLLAERSGILNWALAGAKAYATSSRLGSCDAVKQHKARLRRESDVVGGWLTDHCTVDEEAKMQSSAAYASYSAYAKRLGKTPMGMPAFGARLLREGFPRKETKKFNCFVGIALKP